MARALHSDRRMMRSLHHEVMVETLLNSLAVERHARRALVLELLNEMSASRYSSAKDDARILLRRLERGEISEPELADAITRLRARINALVEVGAHLA
jgi:hypothetical protein